MASTRFPGLRFLLIGIAGFLLGIAFLYLFQGPMSEATADVRSEATADVLMDEIGMLSERVDELDSNVFKLSQQVLEILDISGDSLEFLGDELVELNERVKKLELSGRFRQ